MKLLFLFLLLSNASIANTNDLKSKLERIRKEFALPSLAALYTSDKEDIRSVATGLRRVDKSKSITIKDKFHIGSCGKAMTATLIAKLVDEGKLSWNQTIGDLLPNIKVHEKLKELSFDHLLVHRSGVRRDTENFETGWLYQSIDSGIFSPKQARKIVAETILPRKPFYLPKSKMNYSNVGYMVLGHIIEEVTGKSYEELLREKIFNPLNMKTCGFGPQSQFKNQPWGHTIINNRITPINDDNPPVFAPAGTIHCSLSDWSKFLRVQINGHNHKSNFLSESSFKKLFSKYNEESSYAYGAWFITKRDWANGEVFQHSGTNTYNFANAWLAPNINSAIISVSTISSKKAFLGTDKAILTIRDSVKESN